MTDSRIPKFYQLSVAERWRVLHERGIVNDADFEALADGSYRLDTEQADRLTENVIGVFSMPLGLGLNFQINGRDYLVPMVVEEPSIIAAVSSAARLVRRAGGFTSIAQTPMILGQVQVLSVPDPAAARERLLERAGEILELANRQHPNMVARGGGATGIEVLLHGATAHDGELLVVHLIVDSRDAMGANLVNTMCEAVAPLIEQISGGRVFLRILSNLADRALVHARAVIPAQRLESGQFTGEQVRDGVVRANEFAAMDRYRATTHNKGIMNGIDAVAIATGNDWRAIEASAHAYAARGGVYAPLTAWQTDADGNLVGELTIPLKVGTVGGQVESNPVVRIANSILGVETAAELAEVMAAVGLAQNLAALKALSTEGIQPGHMRLHARSVAVAAGATGALFDTVVDRLVAGGDIKVWKARRILEGVQVERARAEAASASEKGQSATRDAGSSASVAEVTESASGDAESVAGETAASDPGASAAAMSAAVMHSGFGKIILFGEHAVVYGAHAVAAPIALGIHARAVRQRGVVELSFPQEEPGSPTPAVAELSSRVLALVAQQLGVGGEGIRVEVFADLPRASGLGASAAQAVALIRAVADCCGIPIDDAAVNAIAFECERIVHGTPSGIDNTVATFGKPILFRRADAERAPQIVPVVPPHPIPVIIGLSGVRSLTSRTVENVRAGRDRWSSLYDAIFAQIDTIARAGADALGRGDIAQLGDLMNINHGLLNALQVSSPELEMLVDVARRAGALGAKLTGGGGGGAMIALAELDNTAAVAAAMRRAGFATFATEIR
ncbi:hydroxymethylglutaryl-CoA reductase, degradative [Rathayibacter soli]|uniref:hydroxymethylglutaryl-CoA reductase, degradative n=1 Tax=Rathayibacter soli TaxID=3144168 RepID=UPI0027E459F3|nr:hydroxymethylglutaryl-CoA reductase, degradative [Glaciibacter superstes]